MTRLSRPKLKPQVNPTSRQATIEVCLKRARNRSLLSADARILRQWAGEIDVLPDFLPALGELDDSGSVVVATGFSGHGFGTAPAVARVVRDLIAGKRPEHDLTRFRPQRFSDGTRLQPGPTF